MIELLGTLTLYGELVENMLEGISDKTVKKLQKKSGKEITKRPGNQPRTNTFTSLKRDSVVT